MLLQLEAGAKAAETVLDDKSGELVAAVILAAFAAWTMWQQSKTAKESAERHAERDTEDKKRSDDQNQFHRDMALRNADQLDAMTTSLDRTSRATEIMATCADRIDSQLSELSLSQQRDRRAVMCVIDSSDAKSRGEDAAASQSLKEARNHLITGDGK